MAEERRNETYQIPDSVWEKIKPLLLPVVPKPEGGCPRMDDRKAMAAILYVFRTGCHWESLPPSFGSGIMVYHRFQEWQKSGLFQRMWMANLLTYEQMEKMVWYGRE